MKAQVRIYNLNSETEKVKIMRNLHRIMDICIVEVNVKKRLLCFLYQNKKAFTEVKKELVRIGFPIEKVIRQNGSEKKRKPTAYGPWEMYLE